MGGYDWPEIYRARRAALRGRLPGGAILLLGERLVPRNYPHNTYPFRQSSHLLYFAGIPVPDIALTIDPDGGATLYAEPPSMAEVIWTGPLPTPADFAAGAGIDRVKAPADLPADIAAFSRANVPLHHLAPYRECHRDRLAALLAIPPGAVAQRASRALAEAIVHLRLHKGPEEIDEIEAALAVTAEMHRTAMAMAKPGVVESEIAAAIQGIALRHDRQQAYGPIVSVRGEVLHNVTYGNVLREGQLLLNDSAAESPRGYASDITRTTPVGGHFTDLQRALYDIVLRANEAVIAGIRPGVPYKTLHLMAARSMVLGLIDLGLMQGSADEAVAAGAHACFFPHGLGHALGLDVHDMEDLGEDLVGYAPGQQRSSQFGLAYLRFARSLEEGHVVTVEPGLYFIPALMDQWEAEGRHREFIRYDALRGLRELGGIRIEDDVLVTADGARVLGPEIPKSVEEVSG
ncbi:MAG TPA: aminopeptidase P family protein [bacterium]|nr:aminopeptidase P family protein [bacterium]